MKGWAQFVCGPYPDKGGGATGPSSENRREAMCVGVLVQAVRGFSVHFWKKLPYFAQMTSNMYSFDPDIAQSFLTRITPN